MHYAGVGARATPSHILEVMHYLARKLESKGYILRSGGAAGADSAFESGVMNPQNREIYLPGRSFNQKFAGQQGYIDATTLPSWNQAMATVAQYHPKVEALSNFARSLMARNAMQVLGRAMDAPAKMLIAWTPSGQITGGTGQALRIANAYKVPIRNLGDPATLQNAIKFIESNN
ncbi:hypothetical protein EBT25_03520 [bacterium]|nr:hypothetical protein [bacterium]